MIEGVRVKKLTVILDERGRLMEILRRDDEIFIRFGQVYMTTALPGVVKAWHYHKKQTDYLTCVSGVIRLALYDARPRSKTFHAVDEFTLNLDEPMVVQIPPLVYHGFKCVSPAEAIVVNTITHPYNRNKPDEYRVDPYTNEVPYDWRK